MRNMRIVVYSVALAVALSFFLPPAAGGADEGRPGWWLRDGIIFAGNWEPLSFRIRNGGVPHDWRTHYEFEHLESTVADLKKSGVNMIVTHFYKGLGLEIEKEDLAYTARLVKNLKKHGMYAGAYIGSTLFSETLYREIPDSRNWVQLDHKGEPIIYSDQYFRERADFTHPGYRSHIKSVVTKAIREYGMNLIHFDNFYTMFPLDAGYTEHIQELFREHLERRYTAGERKERLGFSDVSHIRPPRVADKPMRPVRDPLVQEWIEFRCETLAGFVRELSEHIRGLDPETVVEINPHGIWGQNNAYSNGMDHARILPLTDIFWSEDPDHAHYYEKENRLVSKIRSYKLARRFGNALFSYDRNELELAEAMAFNRMCPGDVGWPILEESREAERRYLRFFHENKEFYRGLETIDDVGVMRDFASITFGGWKPFLATVQAEQVLIQTRVPFTLCFDSDWERLSGYKAVVLAAQENLSDREIALAREYVERGGALVVVGNTGGYDDWRRLRQGGDGFWQLLGLAGAPQEPARLTLGKGRIFFLPHFENHSAVPETDSEVHPDYWHLPLNWEEFLEGVRWACGGEFSISVETKPSVVAAHYRKSASHQVHLVNYRTGHPVRHIPVIFSESSFKPKKAVLYSPEHRPLRLEPAGYRGGWMVLVPEVATYGVLVVE